LKPRGNVHTVAEQVSTAHHHVTDVDTNTEADATVGCDPRVSFGQGSLRLHRALNCVNGASELGKDTVASRVGYTAPVLPNEPIEDRTPFCQAPEGADLVSAHETAVALHICCEDGDKASADFRRV
jgi:hypothetical protein